jgi:hypothetical protein
VCLLRGTDWVFIYNSSFFVFVLSCKTAFFILWTRKPLPHVSISALFCLSLVFERESGWQKGGLLKPVPTWSGTKYHEFHISTSSSTLSRTTPFFSSLHVEDDTDSIPANHLFLYISVLYFIHIPPAPYSCLFPCLLDMPTSSVLGHKNLQPKCSAWFESVIFLRSWQYNPSALTA